MQNSKLLRLLRALQPEEIHWFLKFLNSPFYNNNTLPIQLFNYIKKYYPELDSPKLSKEATFKKLFPKEKLNIQKLRKTMHGLALLVEEFLIAMQVRKNDYQKKKLLVTELGERNVYSLFEKKTKAMLKELEALPYRDAHFYKEVHELNLGYYGHVETNKIKGNMPALKMAVENLDHYYLMQRQRLEFPIKDAEKLFKIKLKIGDLNQARNRLLKHSTYKLYTLISEMILTPWNEDAYLSVESIFKNDVKKLGKNDTLEIFRILLNQLSGQLNRGKGKYNAKIFSLYKFGLVQHFLTDKGQMSEITFTNIASIGISQRELEWVEGFIEEYKEFLPDPVRDDATRLSLGLLFFYKKEYQKTIKLILNQPFSEPLHILKSRAILLRAYFEQFLLDSSYYELVLDQINAFEKFIRRNDLISNLKKKMYLNFIVLIRKMTVSLLQNSFNDNLYKRIETTKVLILKSWLLQKTQELLIRKKRFPW